METPATKAALRVNADTEDKRKLERLRGVLNTAGTIINNSMR